MMEVALGEVEEAERLREIVQRQKEEVEILAQVSSCLHAHAVYNYTITITI